MVNATLVLAINSPEVDEGNLGATTTLRYVVTLNSARSLDVIVRYNIAGNSTATRDSDYVAANTGTLTFTPTVTRQNIDVTVNGDTLHELTETIIIRVQVTSLLALDGEVIDATGIGGIINDDPAPVVSLVLTPNSIASRGGVTTVTARLDPISSVPTTLTVSAAPVSPAVAGDYRLSDPPVLTIAAEALSSTGDVTITAVDTGATVPGEVTVSATVANISNDLTDPPTATLTITPPIPGANICNRTEAVRDAILAAAGTTDCTDVNLASVTELNLSNRLGTTALQSSDFVDLFAGLTRLKTLDLGRNSAAFAGSLPPSLFSDLQSLTRLVLSFNGLTALPAGIFTGLSALESLFLRSNALASIDVDAFNGLDALKELDLENNLKVIGDLISPSFRPGGLPAGVFDEVLDTLGAIGSEFQVDSSVRAAHFVCSRSDFAAIAAFVGTADCLRVRSAQFDIYRNTRLSGLVISAGTLTSTLTPVFAPDTTAYTAVTPAATVTVTPTASQTGATITVNGRNVNSGNTSNPIDLITGTTTPIAIVVTAAEAAGAQTYTVTVTRVPLPVITAIELTSGAGDDGIYAVGDTIDATVTFDVPVIVSGRPQLALTVGTQTRQAVYTSGTTPSETPALVFRYTVRVGDSDSDGVTIAENSLSHTDGSTIRDARTAIADAVVAHQVTVGLPNPEHRVDGVVPTVTRVAISTTTGPYAADEVIELTATFSEAVRVVGTPQIPLTVGTATRQAVYTGGSDSSVLAFSYTVVAGDTDDDGVEVAQNALTANGGTIRDIVGNAAVLAHAAVAADTVNRVDNVAPTLMTATVESNILTLTYDELLDASSAPAPEDYTLAVRVSTFDVVRNVTAVTVSGPTVRLVLVSFDNIILGVNSDYIVRLAYAATAANPLRDLAGNRAAGFPLRDVENNTGRNTRPDFGSQTIGPLSYIVGRAIPTLTLPTPTGGNGALIYTLTPPLPNGLTFNAAQRQITGTPTATQNPVTYTYNVGDSDGSASVDDEGSLTFTIAIRTNQAPIAVGTIDPRTVTVGLPPVAVDVAGHFSDPDGDSLTYQASSADDTTATVSVQGSIVTISAVAAGDTTIQVTAADVSDTDSNASRATQDIAVTVQPVNTPSLPEITHMVLENADNNGKVGSPLTPINFPAGEQQVWSITAGNDAGVFAINPTTGQLTVIKPLDFETMLTTYTLTVQLTVGAVTAQADRHHHRRECQRSAHHGRPH